MRGWVVRRLLRMSGAVRMRELRRVKTRLGVVNQLRPRTVGWHCVRVFRDEYMCCGMWGDGGRSDCVSDTT